MSASLRRSSRIQRIISNRNVTTSSITTPQNSKINETVKSTVTIPSSHSASQDRPRKRAKLELEDGERDTAAPAAPSRRKKSPASEAAQGALHPDNFPKRFQTPWKVGAHVSGAGGVENTVLNAASVGANSFALFLKSQRKWSAPEYSGDSIEAFKARMSSFNYSPHLVLPHGSYLINLGNPDKEKREKAYECFLDELKRCELLGLTLYNFHPGSTVGMATKEESLGHVAACVNRAHKETSHVVTVIENMAGHGNVLGAKFEEIAFIIDKIIDKSRVGVCLDTCHMFAAGYDIRTKEAYESTISEFDRLVGLRYLRGMHMNDSKADFASCKDRHENIGQGHIRLPAFGYIMRDIRLQNIPLILETPTFENTSVWQKEIEILNALSANETDGTIILETLSNDIRSVALEIGGRKKKKKEPKKGLERRAKRGKASHNGEDEAGSEEEE